MNTQMPVLKQPSRKRRGSKRLLFIIFLLFASILTVLFFNSSISKIETIEVTDNYLIRTEDILSAANVAPGDPFFQTLSSTIAERIELIPQIEQAKVEKLFPGRVIITVTEYPVVAFELTSLGEVQALLANGSSILARSDASLLLDKPVLTGWSSDNPYKTELTKQLSAIDASQLSDLSEIIPIPSTAYPDRIRIYTRTKFEVITAVSVLSEKIEAMNAVIETQEPGKITMLLADTYVPFVAEEPESEETE